MNSILIVDDEDSMRDVLSIMLKKEGYEVMDARCGKDAIKLLNEKTFDLVITDLKMPGGISGIDVLLESKKLHPQTQIIVITAYATTETAVNAMKSGAYDYITKPFKIDEVKIIIQKALEKKQLKEENIYLKHELKEKYKFHNIIGKSDEMQKVFELIIKVSASNSTVLITGESGTGKELVAKAIHFNSSRSEKPLMSVSCGALPEQLLESELFGHVKGAFTSADSDKKGLIEVANTGSFFLDEIGEAPLQTQVKLLRVLQEREFRRVGDVRDIKVDVRIIAATNKILLNQVEKGSFREDLFYRLNVIQIELPPLRKRKKDIPLLINHFIKKFNKITSKDIKGISSEAIKSLETYNWPGNIRELENVIERAIVLETADMINKENLPEKINNSELKEFANSSKNKVIELTDSSIELEQILDNIEKDFIVMALKKANGKTKKAADFLNINMRSMRYRMQKHSILKE